VNWLIKHSIELSQLIDKYFSQLCSINWSAWLYLDINRDTFYWIFLCLFLAAKIYFIEFDHKCNDSHSEKWSSWNQNFQNKFFIKTISYSEFSSKLYYGQIISFQAWHCRHGVTVVSQGIFYWERRFNSARSQIKLNNYTLSSLPLCRGSDRQLLLPIILMQFQ